MADEVPQEEAPKDSAYLFNATAAAITETSDNLSDGLNSLTQSLSQGNWDDPELANNYASDYAKKLTQRFPEEAASTFHPDNVPEIAPILMSDVKPSETPKAPLTDVGGVLADVASVVSPLAAVFHETPAERLGEEEGKKVAGGEPNNNDQKLISQIDAWEKQNLDNLAKTKDPLYTVLKSPLSDSIKEYASKARRDILGKSEDWLSDTYNREAEGAADNILKLFGADEAVKNLYEHTDPTVDGSIRGKLASAIGSTAGFLGASQVPGGFIAYGAATAAGATRDTYKKSLDKTGDSGRATIAGGVELAAQGVSLLGGKLAAEALEPEVKAATDAATQAVSKGVEKTFGKDILSSLSEWFKGAGKEGIKLGTVNTVSGIISEGANKYGGGKDAADSLPNTAEDWKGYAEDFVINSGIGAGLHSIPREPISSTTAAKDTPDENLQGIKVKIGPEPIKENQLNDIPAPVSGPEFSGQTFQTESGDHYQVTRDGRTAARTDITAGTSYHPLARTFFVDAPTAAKVALLEQTAMPDGSVPYIFTDGERLLLNSSHISGDLVPTQEETGGVAAIVPVHPMPAPGLYPIEVGHQQNGLTSKVPSYFGNKIVSVNEAPETLPGVGSAGPFKVAPSEAMQRILASADVSPAVKEHLKFLDEHLVIPRGTKEAEAADFTKSQGIGAAYEKVMNRGEHENSGFLVALAARGAETYQSLGDFESQSGNQEVANKFYDLSAQMHEQWDQMRSAAGHTLGQVETISPAKNARDYLVSVREKAKNQAAKEEGITREDLENNDRELKAVNTELEQAQIPAEEKASVSNLEANEELKAINEGIKTHETEAERRHNDALKQTEAAATQDETEAKALEERHTRRFEEENKSLREALNAAETRVAQLNEAADQRLKEASKTKEETGVKVSELEAKGKKRAEALADSEIEKAQSTATKLKENKAKGAKVKPEAIEAADKNLERKRAAKESISPTDGMTAEEKKAYQKLLRERDKPLPKSREETLKSTESKEIEELNKKILRGREYAKELTPELPADIKEKINFLKNRARSKRAEETSKNLLDRLGKREQATLNKLKEKKASYPKEKGTKGKEDFLTPAEKTRISELLTRKKTLEERAKRTQSKIQAAIDEAAPKAKKLRELIEKANSSSGRTRDEFHAAALKIKHEENLDAINGPEWRRIWTGNEISSPNTFERKTIGEITQAEATILGYVGRLKFGEAFAAQKGLTRTAFTEIGNFISDAKEAFRKDGWEGFQKLLAQANRLTPRAERLGLDTKKGNVSMTEGAKDLLNTNDFSGSQIIIDPKRNIAVRAFHQALNTIFGTFATGQAIFSKSLYEGVSQAKAFEIAKTSAKRGEGLRSEIAEKLLGSESTYQQFLKQAQAEAKDLSQYGVQWSDRDIRSRAAELMESYRDKNVSQAAQAMMDYYNYSKTPNGIVGWFFKGIEKLADSAPGIPFRGKEYRPLPYLARFLNIGGNILNNQLEFTPYGYLKAFTSSEDTNSKYYLHPEVRKNIVGKANLGFALTAGLLTKLYNQKDDKNPLFDIHGAGPSNPSDGAAFRAAGHRPFSIELNTGTGRKVIPLPVVTGPLALMLGLVGSVNDSFKYDQKKTPPVTVQDKALALSGALAVGMIRSIANEPFFKSWGMFADAVHRGDNLGIADSLVIQPAKGFIPLIGLERYVNKFLSSPGDSYKNLSAKILADTPFAVLANGDRLNPVGEVIKEDWLGDHGPLAPFLISQNSDKDFAWLSDNGYHVPMMKHHVTLKGLVGEDETDPSKSPGSIVDNVLTDSERARILQESASDVRNILKLYREQFGAAAYSQNIQSSLSSAINGVRNKKKYELFFK